MPEPKLPLTSTMMIAGAQPHDVRVVETASDNVHVQVARGPVAVQFYGTLQELQLVVVAITDGLVQIGQARGLEAR